MVFLLCHEELWALPDSPEFIISWFCTSEGPSWHFCHIPHPCNSHLWVPLSLPNPRLCSALLPALRILITPGDALDTPFCASSCWRAADNETEGEQVQNCHRKILFSTQGWALERKWKLIAATKASYRQWWWILVWILIILIPRCCKCPDNRSVLPWRGEDIILKRTASYISSQECLQLGMWDLLQFLSDYSRLSLLPLTIFRILHWITSFSLHAPPAHTQLWPWSLSEHFSPNCCPCCYSQSSSLQSC